MTIRDDASAKRLMILGTLKEMCGIVRKAGRRGIYTIVCDGNPDGPARSLADKDYTIDVRRIGEIAEICRIEHVDGIITSFSDLMFECMVKIAERAGIPCYMPEDLLPAYRNKEKIKSICRELGIAVPAYVRLEADFDDDDIKRAGVEFPAVLKPLDSYGSRGLRVVHDISEVRRHFAKSAAFSGDGSVMLETMSRGRELNVQAFLADGELYLLTVADRFTAFWRSDMIPVNYANRYPSDCFDESVRKVRDVLERYTEHTGQKWGPVSMQCFFDGQKIEVCEMTGRYFGFEHELTELSTGLDIEELLIDLVFDREAAVRKAAGCEAGGTGYAEGIYLTTVKEGVLRDQSELEALSASDEVDDAWLFYEKGERVGVFGPKPYFARFYITASDRASLIEKERKILARCSASGENGEELLFRPDLSSEARC